MFAVAQDVRDGDVHGGDAGAWRTPPGGVPGGVVVDVVAAWWSVCRGGFLADGGAGGGFVGDGLAGSVGGEQRGDGEPVDGTGQAASVAVDDADGVVGYPGSAIKYLLSSQLSPSRTRLSKKQRRRGMQGRSISGEFMSAHSEAGKGAKASSVGSGRDTCRGRASDNSSATGREPDKTALSPSVADA